MWLFADRVQLLAADRSEPDILPPLQAEESMQPLPMKSSPWLRKVKSELITAIQTVAFIVCQLLSVLLSNMNAAQLCVMYHC